MSRSVGFGDSIIKCYDLVSACHNSSRHFAVNYLVGNANDLATEARVQALGSTDGTETNVND
ncbi:hypothetical protein [Myxacorys almedinensis]|uniref:Uncharacterized protein n=1 Tax=Myxacorys almedinensis A TaxID=2690445 RepID=A0A8J7Z9F9_9CYAN|nr:hypothetical protein [Myxacorys almedinensis]NDJ18883.1 hypothetical protein [Myxacorys almedinensis A]